MKYVDICIALYDYQAQSEEELSFTADTILYILENDDPNWYRAQLKAASNEEEGQIGSIPSNYVEKIKLIGQVKALYDYEAQSAAEVSLKEDESLTLYESKDKDWCIVEKEQGDIGLAPSNYIEKATEPSASPLPSTSTSPPLVPSASASSEPDIALSWPVHVYDMKKKKKTKSKGNLLVGNGLLCFGSETDKSSPVRQFPISQVKHADIDSKVVQITLENESLGFQLASQSEAKAVVAKIHASQKASQPSQPAVSQKVDQKPVAEKPLPPLSPTKEPKWAIALYAFKPDADEETYLEEHEQVLVTDDDSEDWWTVEHKDGTSGIVPANYIQFQEDYEASLKVEEEKKMRDEEEQRLREEKEKEEARKKQEQEEQLRKEEEARKKLELEEEIKKKQEEETRQRLEKEAKEKQEEEERKQREEDMARKKQEEEELAKKQQEEEELAKKKQEEERLKREEEERKIEEQERQDELKRIKEIEQRERERQAESERRRRLQDETIQNELRNKRSNLNSPMLNSPRRSEIPAPPPPAVVPKGQNNPSKPNTPKVRTWTDSTGEFKVQAQFVSYANGKIRLLKSNGDQIDVPVDKMCKEDIHYVEKETGMKLEMEPFSWLEYFKRANLPHDACVDYAANFEANQLSQHDIEKLTHDQMIMLGMSEEHVQRIQRFIETNTPPSGDEQSSSPQLRKRKSVSFGDVSYIEADPYEDEHEETVQSQIEEDERLARELQEQEEQEYNRVGLQRRGTGRTYPAPPVPNATGSPQQLPLQPNSPSMAPPHSPLNSQFYSGFEGGASSPRPSTQPAHHWNPLDGSSYPVLPPQMSQDPQFLAKWRNNPALAEANLRPVPAPPTGFSPSPSQQQQSANSFPPSSPMFQQPYPPPLSPQHSSDSVGRNWTKATPQNPFGGAPQQQQPFYIVPPSQQSAIDPNDKYAAFKNINHTTPNVFNNTTRYQ